MGMIHTRSERDIRATEAAVWEAAARVMERKLPQIPEVAVLIEVFREEGADALQKASEANQRLGAEANLARSALRF